MARIFVGDAFSGKKTQAGAHVFHNAKSSRGLDGRIKELLPGPPMSIMRGALSSPVSPSLS